MNDLQLAPQILRNSSRPLSGAPGKNLVARGVWEVLKAIYDCRPKYYETRPDHSQVLPEKNVVARGGLRSLKCDHSQVSNYFQVLLKKTLALSEFEQVYF